MVNNEEFFDAVDEPAESDEPIEIPQPSDQDTPVESDKETDLQIQEAADCLTRMPELQPELWQQLDANQRLEVLQNIEEQMAQIQGRPPLSVEQSQLPDNTFGAYDGQVIQINAADLAGEAVPVSEFVNTIAHEGRHAYQDYAVKNPGFHADGAEVQAWADNLAPGNYLCPEEYGQELYQNQPIEADAWQYADQISQAIYGDSQK